SPVEVRELDKDRRGNVVGCTFAEMRPDPEARPGHRREVEYRRTMTRRDDGQVDVYTYRDGEPYDWGDGPDGKSAWTLAVDFVPLRHVQHRRIGFGWGASELSGVR